jgi:hypothetical protein
MAGLGEPASPWENGYYESFNGKLRDEYLNGEIFYSLKEAQVVIEQWRVHYNTQRPHSSLGYRPPARRWRVPNHSPLAHSRKLWCRLSFCFVQKIGQVSVGYGEYLFPRGIPSSFHTSLPHLDRDKIRRAGSEKVCRCTA